jgi:hypothetical protein
MSGSRGILTGEICGALLPGISRNGKLIHVLGRARIYAAFT